MGEWMAGVRAGEDGHGHGLERAAVLPAGLGDDDQPQYVLPPQQAAGGSLDEVLAGLMNLVTELRQRVDLLEQQNTVLDDEVAQLARAFQPRKGGQRDSA